MKNKRLEKINASAMQFNYETAEGFRKICSPLDIIGVSWFAYAKLFHDGRYLYMDNDLNHLKNHHSCVKDAGEYFTKELQNASLNKMKRSFIPNDINLYNEKTDHALMLGYEHNIWNINLMFKNINNKYIEVYLFGMDRGMRDAENYYFDNNDLLLKFVDYFKDAAKPIVEIPGESHFAHLEQSFDFHQIPDEQLTTDKVSQFLKDVHVEKRFIQGKYEEVKLTKREIECLDYLALGYGMKGVADILDLSSRTVESYINNAKLKTGYSSKQLLLTQFIKDFKSYSPIGR